MGHKKLCLDCRKVFSREFDFSSARNYKCPDCGKTMILMPHRFRPPKRTDDRRWETVRILVENGFRYQHIFNHIETNEGLISESVRYPESPREANEFMEKYRKQALQF